MNPALLLLPLVVASPFGFFRGRCNNVRNVRVVREVAVGVDLIQPAFFLSTPVYPYGQTPYEAQNASAPRESDLERRVSELEATAQVHTSTLSKIVTTLGSIQEDVRAIRVTTKQTGGAGLSPQEVAPIVTEHCGSCHKSNPMDSKGGISSPNSSLPTESRPFPQSNGMDWPSPCRYHCLVVAQWIYHKVSKTS